MHRIARNIYNSLFVVDLSKSSVLEIFTEIFVFIERGVPIRFGVVPIVDLEKKTEISNYFFFFFFFFFFFKF